MHTSPQVRASIDGLLTSGAVLGVDLVKLAWQCASTFRVTDYTGGCNGARVLQQPQSSWAGNAGLGAVKQQLSVVKAAHGRALSWADLIVLAGNTALEAMGGQSVPFCPGRCAQLPSSRPLSCPRGSRPTATPRPPLLPTAPAEQPQLNSPS